MFVGSWPEAAQGTARASHHKAVLRESRNLESGLCGQDGVC